jgi:hypothetical protein
MRMEYATANVPDAVLEDFRFMKAAYERGEFCGRGYVERRADGSRRIVNEPASTPRRPTARPSSYYARRVAQLKRELAADRDARQAQAEREVAQAKALRTGPSTHFGIEVYRASADPGPVIMSVSAPKR